MVFDRANIVPLLEYRHSQVISLWELQCFFHSAEAFFRYGLDEMTNESSQKALKTMKETLEGYQPYWPLAGTYMEHIYFVHG